MHSDSHRREAGQAAVETAIVLPLFLALLLGLVQLALLHQAALLTEYAAFQAARAGVVWNGDPTRMQDAAIFVLAPTACPTRVPAVSALCSVGEDVGPWARQAAGFAALQALSAAGDLSFPGVHVHILNPFWPAHRGLFTVGPDHDEMDFDSLSDPVPAGEAPQGSTTADASRAANVLTIQVQYWFELKIPFADWVIWHAYVAALEGLHATGSIGDPSSDGDRRSIVEHEGEGSLAARAARLADAFSDDEIHRGHAYRTVRAASLEAMLASGLGPGDRRERGFFIPIVAHHSMRMQSNFYSRYIRGCSCFEGHGCSPTCKAW